MFIRRIVIYAAIILLACILGANVYNSVVDAPNWGASIPDSLATAKQYYRVANPGSFFRAIAPGAQIAAVAALIASWRAGGRARILAGAALVLAVLGDVFTFGYFYPRNEIMFGAGQYGPSEMTEAWSGWSMMNHVRSLVIAAAVICELATLSIVERMWRADS